MNNNIPKKPVVLLVLDGWGHREETKDNAVSVAKTPTFDLLWKSYPHTLLHASGEYVGLPDGQVGNSEIGHTTIGAGTAIPTDLVRITKDAINGDFEYNEAFMQLWNHCIQYQSNLHIMGLLSDGGVHSHIRHIIEFIKTSHTKKIPRIVLHVFSDGRDVNRDKFQEYFNELVHVTDEMDNVIMGTVTGRYYAMDRDNNWDRMDKFMNMLIDESYEITDKGVATHIESHYANDIFDEHLEPLKLNENIHLHLNDGVFIANFRADRVRMLTEKLLLKKQDLNLCIVTLTEYKSDYDVLVAYKPITIETTLARELSLSGVTQSHLAETEKFPHATYFLNGGAEIPFDGEEHILIPTRKDVKTHDEAPEMRAMDIAHKACEEIDKGREFLFINIANPDIVGHTGNVPAIIKAVEVTDDALKVIVDKVISVGGILMVTADHGNAEENIDEKGSVHTSHTLNMVPCIMVGISDKELVSGGTLADLAPTVLGLMGVVKPKSMTGESLIIV